MYALVVFPHISPSFAYGVHCQRSDVEESNAESGGETAEAEAEAEAEADVAEQPPPSSSTVPEDENENEEAADIIPSAPQNL